MRVRLIHVGGEVHAFQPSIITTDVNATTGTQEIIVNTTAEVPVIFNGHLTVSYFRTWYSVADF